MNPAKDEFKAVPPLTSLPPARSVSAVRRARTLGMLLCLLLACFAIPVYQWARFAAHSQLFSYVLLVPVISIYLAWEKRDQLFAPSRPNRLLAWLPLTAAILVISIYAFRHKSGEPAPASDPFTWTIGSFYLFFLAASCLSLGTQALRALSFPLAFLGFIVPFPGFLVSWAETFLQHASAVTAQGFFALTGMAVFRDGLVFQLPGIRLEVAPECSGIHSTLVLLLTSLVAGHLFLRSPWKRLVFAAAVVPLGVLRNAIRICTIGHLCVHVSPAMINSPIHRRGGPLFFAVSLVPLFLLLYYLRKSERRNKATLPINLN